MSDSVYMCTVLPPPIWWQNLEPLKQRNTHRFTYGTGSLLKLNSLNAVKLENQTTFNCGVYGTLPLGAYGFSQIVIWGKGRGYKILIED